MRTYLTNLITEKGVDLDTEIKIDGHIGFTYQILIDCIEDVPQFHDEIKTKLVQIDFKNGDVFHYLDFLAKCVIEARGE